jgi:hypothetical protein
MLLLSGCVTTQVEQFMPEAPIIGANETIVVLTNRQDAVVEAEKNYVDCLYDRLAPLRNQVTMIHEDDFKDALFPWFEPRLAPTHAEAVAILLEQPAIAKRTKELNIRYLVWVYGESAASNRQGSLSCSFSAAGGGCFGMLSWDNNSNYEATIWDMKESRSLGLISSESVGTSMVPALVVPIPIIARTKSASCRGMGDQLNNVLSGRS